MNLSMIMNSSSLGSDGAWERTAELCCTIFTHVLNYLLELPLNSRVMVLLVHRCGSLGSCDVFTLNRAALEIFFLLLALFHLACVVDTELCFNKPFGFVVGIGMSVRSLLQCCVCLDRYLAVIHPITFLKFRAVRYRAAICAMAWASGLACGVVCMFMFPFLPYKAILAYSLTILSISVFSCVSILRALRHLTPGERSADTETEVGAGVKKRAFHIVVNTLLTFLVQNIPISAVYFLQDTLSMMDFNLALAITLAINILMGFLNPTFVLLKAGKLSFMKSACS